MKTLKQTILDNEQRYYNLESQTLGLSESYISRFLSKELKQTRKLEKVYTKIINGNWRLNQLKLDDIELKISTLTSKTNLDSNLYNLDSFNKFKESNNFKYYKVLYSLLLTKFQVLFIGYNDVAQLETLETNINKHFISLKDNLNKL